MSLTPRTALIISAALLFLGIKFLPDLLGLRVLPTEYKTGLNYLDGLGGLPKDEALALKYFRSGANTGYALAQNELGVLYALGRGVPQDNAQAAFWYRKAADQGNAVAQSNLASLYLTGDGLPKDEYRAAIWYRKAADQGYQPAQDALRRLMNSKSP
jgi:TPR repeat protein